MEQTDTKKNNKMFRFQGQGLFQLQSTLARAVVGHRSRDSTRKLRDDILLLEVRALQPTRAGTFHLSLYETVGGHRKLKRSAIDF